ncbi:MAG TPA: hypothetical protein VFB23_08185 [Candidatus Acidoferrales bacterium]|nr:hypothetical protein [Candidatus Acidoferrales bacterium]
MAKDYAVRLRCPYRDENSWIILQNRDETRDQVLQTPWDFECSLHGVQKSMPLEVIEKRDAKGAAVPSGAPPRNRLREDQRASKRAMLRIPVVVYGWAKNHGAFHEQTFTEVVNASGGLVTLGLKVEPGEMLFIVNKNTREEQECRVAYVQKGPEGKSKIGLAFKRPIPSFWRKNARKARKAQTMQVWVRGIDRSGKPFVQSAHTIDIGKDGARLDGVGYLTGPGEVVLVKRGWRKARFRVVWIGQIGTPEANQVGICCLENGKDIWRVPVDSESEKNKKVR